MKKTNLLLTGTALLCSAMTAMAATVVDRDGDGLIEINSVEELNEIRNNSSGTALFGSSTGCPRAGCNGFELVRSLDFDTDGDGNNSEEAYWNDGKGWEPISNFSAVFDGNGHRIKGLYINRPTESNVGLFGQVSSSTIRNLILSGGPTVTGSSVVGTLAGRVTSSIIKNISAIGSGAAISKERVVGGLIGGVIGSNINNCSSTADVVLSDNTNPIDRTFGGGLIGSVTTNSVVEHCFATGDVSGKSILGGLIGIVEGSRVIGSFATGGVGGTGGDLGGLVGRINPQTSDNIKYLAMIDASYATGNVTSSNTSGGMAVGSLIGAMNSKGTDQNYTMLVLTSYAIGWTIPGGGTYAARLIGQLNNPSVAILDHNLWASDPGGVLLVQPEPTQGIGALTASLKCPTAASDTACLPGTTLFEDWDEYRDSADVDLWNMGTSTELPYLYNKSNFPWVNSSGRTSGSTGDNETASRIKEYYPQYSCDNPTAFEAHIPGRPIVYAANYPEKFDYFNVNQGLACINNSQSDNVCNNYEVSYLCDSGWTSWSSKDKPSSGRGDFETFADTNPSCSAPTEIRARVKGKSKVYYGTPDKLKKFSIADGLQCDDSDQNGLSSGCKDYSVRFSCPVRSVFE